MNLLIKIANSIRSAANYNPEVESPPQCILWTDKDKLWEQIIFTLKGELPELLVLGDYNLEHNMGPAIWLKVAISGLFDSYTVPVGKIPVIYLPGVSRHDLRAVENCSEELKPIAELQYRGVIWSQLNSRDWTPLAYFKSNKGGLGLNIQQDNQTIEALERTLSKLLFEEIDSFKDEYLDKDYFNALLTGGDPIKDVLTWMNDPSLFRNSKTNEEWTAFVEICVSKLCFNPEHDTEYTVAEKIVWKDSKFDGVWDRFCEAPGKYEIIPEIMRKTVMPIGIELDRSPQWNDQQEKALRKDLNLLIGLAEHNAREKIIELEKRHRDRRNYIWADRGEALLAEAIHWLNIAAQGTQKVVNGSVLEILTTYEEWGWKVDKAILKALQLVNRQEDIDAVTNAVRSIYIPWIDESARNLQKALGNNPVRSIPVKYDDGECVIFVDGLRFDMGKQLSESLTVHGYDVLNQVRVANVPSLTATCKPALMPIADKLVGLDTENDDFSPAVKETNQKAVSQKLMSLMKKEGWKILKHPDYDKEDEKNAWIDYSHIDEDGHSLGWRIVYNTNRYIDEILDLIETLYEKGWNKIRVVTDHGWLMVPGGLPKTTIAASLVDSKWGRTAVTKPGALVEGDFYQWYWNPDVHFVLAEGVSCYRANTEFTHGGISLQENVLLELAITKETDSKKDAIILTDIMWKGMRCKLAAEGYFESLRLDIRMKPGLNDTSVVMGVKEFSSDGITSVVVDDDMYEGKPAYIVIVDKHDKVVYQQATIIGGEQ